MKIADESSSANTFWFEMSIFSKQNQSNSFNFSEYYAEKNIVAFNLNVPSVYNQLQDFVEEF